MLSNQVIQQVKLINGLVYVYDSINDVWNRMVSTKSVLGFEPMFNDEYDFDMLCHTSNNMCGVLVDEMDIDLDYAREVSWDATYEELDIDIEYALEAIVDDIW